MSSEQHDKPVMNPALREKLRRIHGALARIDGLSFEERVAAVERGLIGQRELDVWQTLADLYYEEARSYVSADHEYALATLLVVWMGGSLARIRQARTAGGDGPSQH